MIYLTCQSLTFILFGCTAIFFETISIHKTYCVEINTFDFNVIHYFCNYGFVYKAKKSQNKIISNFCLTYLFNSVKGTGDHELLRNNMENFLILTAFIVLQKRLLNTYNSATVEYILFCKNWNYANFDKTMKKNMFGRFCSPK